ncbi:hypothetical protein MMPV_000236 [Pyropia vietnamensis]
MAFRGLLTAAIISVAAVAAATTTAAGARITTYDAGGTVSWTRPAAPYAVTPVRSYAPKPGGPIANTRMDAVYASSAFRWRGDVEFVLPVPAAGTYDVMLGFAELYFDAPGKRMFDILISGRAAGGAAALRPLRRRYDIFAAAGRRKNRATTVWAKRLAVDASGVRVRLVRVPGKNHPSINVLRIIRRATVTKPVSTPQPTQTPEQEKLPSPSSPSWSPGWSAAPSFPAGQRRHENCFVAHRGEFFLIGGRSQSAPGKATLRYNPRSRAWTWRTAPPFSPGGIHHMQCVSLGDHIYILSAFTGFFPREETVSRVMVYTPATDRWSMGSSLIPAAHRRGAAAAVAMDGSIYVAGGNVGGHGIGSTSQTTLSRFTPPAGGSPNGRWEMLPPAPRRRDHVSAVVVDGQLVLAGGRDGGAANPFAGTHREIDVYSFAARKWRTLRSRLAVGRGAPVVGALDKLVVVAGGGTEVLDLAADKMLEVDAPMRWGVQGTRGRHATTGAVCNGVLYAAAGSGRQGGGPELSTMELFSFSQPPAACE